MAKICGASKLERQFATLHLFHAYLYMREIQHVLSPRIPISVCGKV